MIEPERDPELTLEQRYQREVDTRKRMQSELQQLHRLLQTKDEALHVAKDYVELLGHRESALAGLVHARVVEALFSKPSGGLPATIEPLSAEQLKQLFTDDARVAKSS